MRTFRTGKWRENSTITSPPRCGWCGTSIRRRGPLGPAYTAEDRFVEVGAAGVLSGGEVLPGFELPLARLFGKIGPKA
jgi:hypothetical protein